MCSDETGYGRISVNYREHSIHLTVESVLLTAFSGYVWLPVVLIPCAFTFHFVVLGTYINQSSEQAQFETFMNNKKCLLWYQFLLLMYMMYFVIQVVLLWKRYIRKLKKKKVSYQIESDSVLVLHFCAK
jgi:hypothetical protein